MLNEQGYQEQLKQWDAWIREGQAAKVGILCRQLNHKKIPRSLLLEYAQIARRVGAPDLIILWLRSIIYSTKSLEQKATLQEKAIYGLGLLRLGAFGEAEKILNSVDPRLDPQVYFYKASLYINQWAYKKAVPLLKKYIKHPDIPAYQKLVGRLNLCASLVSLEKLQFAEVEISRLMKLLDRGGHQLLKGNLLEIRAQLYYVKGEVALALQSLDQSQQLLKHANKMILFVEKWKILTSLKATPNDPKLLRSLQQLLEKARQAKEWEIVRDCDLHLAQYQKEGALFLKVYWGSLFRDYKEKVKKLSPGKWTESSYYDWGQSDSLQALDIVALAPTKLLKSLFFILTREFYRPLRTTEILGYLYPDNYYNAGSDPIKLQRLIQRARQWITKNNIPVRIQSYRNSYKLELTSAARIRITASLSSEVINYIPKDFKNKRSFSTKEWALVQKVSRRTAQRQIQYHINLGQIEAFSFGPSAKFRFI